MTEIVVATMYRDARADCVDRFFSTIWTLEALNQKFFLRYATPDFKELFHERIELVTNKL